LIAKRIDRTILVVIELRRRETLGIRLLRPPFRLASSDVDFSRRF
jgi:hypothetical protein